MTVVNTVNEKDMRLHKISKGPVDFYFLPGGGLYEIRRDRLMINLYSGTIFDYSPANIFLRLFDEENRIFSTPLLGPGADSKVTISADSIFASGNFKEIDYIVEFIPGDNEEWFWRIRLINRGKEKITADLVYYQDIAISDREAVRRNEYYISQYIDHRAIEDKEHGFILCSRQNEKVNESNPLLITACIGGAAGFLTDGSNFYGAAYRETGIPSALSCPEFEKNVFQGEFACHCLLSNKHRLAASEEVEEVFFSRFVLDHEPVTEKDTVTLSAIPETTVKLTESEFDRIDSIFNQAKMFLCRNLKEEELEKYFPGEKLHLEKSGKDIFSFFTTDKKHIVLKNKELSVERPHGHMLRASGEIYPEAEIGALTVWMNGVFASHVSYGNTSFNQCISNARGTWNMLRTGGLRLFVDNGTGWRKLGVPSAFEMSFNSARWLYADSQNLIQVTAMFDEANSGIVSVRVINGPELDFLCTVNLTMGGNELDSEIPLDINEKGIFIKPATGTLMNSNRPLPVFKINADGEAEYGIDERLYVDGIQRKLPIVTILREKTKKLTVNFSLLELREKIESEETYIARIFNRRNIAGESEGITRISTIFPWFVHNAMIHFSTPAGLEQYSGAAWGVRDICQGPVEMLLAMGHDKIVRRIIHKIFSHQYEQGNWPQWFMFDQYFRIQQNDSHGDVIIWPLKAVCEYIENTNDFSILDDLLPYTKNDFNLTYDKACLFEHLEKLLENVSQSFVPRTKLLSYGGGDWNDSLQPLDHEKAERLVSSWTVQLLYQTLRRFAEVCRRAGKPYQEYDNTACKIKDDFNKHLVKNGITAGFALFNSEGEVEQLLLHPSENITGIKYRLLPVNRGILSNIFTREQAERHFDIAKRFLIMPDGTHLMDNAPAYDHGTQHIFKRAETASYFGREIGTNYIHAHLRFAEAMAKIGKAKELYKALLAANPVELEKTVPNALSRQSNAYFSSSDADFKNRYEAMHDFQLLREGKTKVKGGWRIYSSGPGIYVNLLFTVFCGIRCEYNTLVIDPVIAKDAGEIILDTKIAGCLCRFVFKPDTQEYTPSEIKINGKKTVYEYGSNPYRSGGAEFNLDDFAEQLNDTQTNIIEVTL